MIKLALIGEGVEYSLSPAIHTKLFGLVGVKGTYTLIDVKQGELYDTFQSVKDKYDGFNVTKPYKNALAAFTRENRSPVGAVNTLVSEKKGLVGYNTDIFGFSQHIETEWGKIPPSEVLVLGAGGAAEAAVYALRQMGHRVYIKNRDEKKAKILADRYGAKLYRGARRPVMIVNCTTLGYKAGENPALGINLEKTEYAYDMIYARSTDFLKYAKKSAGAATLDGMGMLVLQAIKAEEHFLGKEFGAEMIKELYVELMQMLGRKVRK